MKTLSSVLMSDFIEMSCGHYDVLREDGENVSKEDLVKKANELSYEYKNVINPSACKAAIMVSKKETERKGRIALFRLCVTLLAIGSEEDVRSVLANVMNVSVPADVLKSKIEGELQRLLFEQKRYEEKKEKPEESKSEQDIRAMFDKEIASLMVFFKMGIDIHTISAGVYANLVNQAYMQMKARSLNQRK